MKNLCEEFYKSDQKKTSPINYLKLINASTSVKCSDCLDTVKKLCHDSLEVLPCADKSAKDHDDFQRIDQLFELLWKLGTDFQKKMKTGEKSRTSTVGPDVFSGKYAPTVDTQSKKDEDKYTFEYKGNDVFMPEHLKIDHNREGPGKGSKSLYLRIHFYWDAKSQKVVIGHCGKHL